MIPPDAPRRSRRGYLWLIPAILAGAAAAALTFLPAAQSVATPPRPNTVGLEAIADMIGTSRQAFARGDFDESEKQIDAALSALGVTFTQ